MATIKRIRAGQYLVSDGRYIVKDGSNWFVLNCDGNHDFGPLPTLTLAKEYVTNGVTTIGNNNLASKYGRTQSKKEFNAYLASEAKNGNYVPIILWFVVLVVITILVLAVRGY